MEVRSLPGPTLFRTEGVVYQAGGQVEIVKTNNPRLPSPAKPSIVRWRTGWSNSEIIIVVANLTGSAHAVV
jgi:hypothetical protein